MMDLFGLAPQAYLSAIAGGAIAGGCLNSKNPGTHPVTMRKLVRTNAKPFAIGMLKGVYAIVVTLYFAITGAIFGIPIILVALKLVGLYKTTIMAIILPVSIPLGAYLYYRFMYSLLD